MDTLNVEVLQQCVADASARVSVANVRPGDVWLRQNREHWTVRSVVGSEGAPVSFVRFDCPQGQGPWMRSDGVALVRFPRNVHDHG